MSEHFVERRAPAGGVWIHWIGDAISLAVMLIGLAVAWGGLNERLVAVEKQTARQEQQATSDRRELKADIQRELAAITTSIQALDAKLTQVLLVRGEVKR